MPSIDRSPLMVAISSGGKAPVLAACCGKNSRPCCPQHLGAVAAFAGSLDGERVKARLPPWASGAASGKRLLGADRLGQALAPRAIAPAPPTDPTICLLDESQTAGEVVLEEPAPAIRVCFTLYALRQMQQADVVVYDRLVSLDEVMALVRRDAKRIFVRQAQAATTALPQEGINQLLLEEAKEG